MDPRHATSIRMCIYFNVQVDEWACNDMYSDLPHRKLASILLPLPRGQPFVHVILDPGSSGPTPPSLRPPKITIKPGPRTPRDAPPAKPCFIPPPPPPLPPSWTSTFCLRAAAPPRRMPATPPPPVATSTGVPPPTLLSSPHLLPTPPPPRLITVSPEVAALARFLSTTTTASFTSTRCPSSPLSRITTGSSSHL